MAINYQNEMNYVQDVLKEAQKTGNKGLETWAKTQAGEYAPKLAEQQAAGVGVTGPISQDYVNAIATGKPSTADDATKSYERSTGQRVSGGGSSGGSFSGSAKSSPFLQQAADILAQTPVYQPLTEEQLTQQAQQYGSLQVQPRLDAINRALEQAQTDAATQRQQIEASYASAPAALSAASEEARSRALESAIARGAGRSGVVDWQAAQIGEEQQRQLGQLEAERTARLGGVTEQLGSLQRQLGQEQSSIATQQGMAAAQYLAELRDLGYSRSAQAVQDKVDAYNRLAGTDIAGRSEANRYALGALPYYAEPAGAGADRYLRASEAFGPDAAAAYAQPSQGAAPQGAAGINIENERAYLTNLLRTGNPGQQAWARSQAGQYGITLG